MEPIKTSTPIPLKIQKHSEKEMLFVWDNHEQTKVSYFNLRFHCNCAECVDEWTRKKRITIESISKDVKPVHVEVVGRYAIQIQWTDGHKTGIYPFDFLYKLTKDVTEGKTNGSIEQ